MVQNILLRTVAGILDERVALRKSVRVGCLLPAAAKVRKCIEFSRAMVLLHFFGTVFSCLSR